MHESLRESALFKNSQTALCSEDGSEQWLVLQTRTSREGAQSVDTPVCPLQVPFYSDTECMSASIQPMALPASELKSSSLSSLQPPARTPQAERAALQFGGPKTTIWFLSTHPSLHCPCLWTRETNPFSDAAPLVPAALLRPRPRDGKLPLTGILGADVGRKLLSWALASLKRKEAQGPWDYFPEFHAE